MQMSCSIIKALDRSSDEAVLRGEDIRCCVLYFAFELVLFLIKQNHCYGDS